MSALVSIIVPIYNLQDYIENCINSLLKQTYENIEIICVDDGSKDDSAQVIRKIQDTDKRVKYFFQENAGVSAARNTGLDKAVGEYIMFVDGDDYLHFQAVEIFVHTIEKLSVDMVCAYEKQTKIINEEMKPITDYEYCLADSQHLFETKNGSVVGKSVWCKILKREAALKARFPVGISTGEDAYYIISVLNSGATTALLDCKLYYYYNRENSAVTSKFNVNKFSITYSFDMLCNIIGDSDDSFLKAYCLQYLFQTIFFNRTLAIGTESEEHVLKESKRIGNKWKKQFIKTKGISVIKKIMFITFFYSRHIYELARGIQDPTMFDFYKNRRK